MHKSAGLLRLAALVAAIVLAGCGGSGKEGASAGSATDAGTASSTTAANGSSTTVDSQSFQECLKDHGIDLPDSAGGVPPSGAPTGAPPAGGTPPAGLPAGADASKFQDAMKACQDKLGSAGPQGAAAAADFTAYRSCMSDHGVRTLSGSGPGGVDQTDPDFAEASTACQALLPAAPTGSSTTTTP